MMKSINCSIYMLSFCNNPSSEIIEYLKLTCNSIFLFKTNIFVFIYNICADADICDPANVGQPIFVSQIFLLIQGYMLHFCMGVDLKSSHKHIVSSIVSLTSNIFLITSILNPTMTVQNTDVLLVFAELVKCLGVKL